MHLNSLICFAMLNMILRKWRTQSILSILCFWMLRQRPQTSLTKLIIGWQNWKMHFMMLMTCWMISLLKFYKGMWLLETLRPKRCESSSSNLTNYSLALKWAWKWKKLERGLMIFLMIRIDFICQIITFLKTHFEYTQKRETYSFVKEFEMIGREDEKKHVLSFFTRVRCGWCSFSNSNCWNWRTRQKYSCSTFV